MDTRKYDNRYNAKRITRHPVYQDVAERNRALVKQYEAARRDLHAEEKKVADANAEIESLKAALAKRNEEIDALKKAA